MKEDIVLRGIGKADNDLKAVKYLLAVEDAPLDVLSFHCQQAVEKYLKAYRISRLTLYAVEIRYPEEHIETDLEEVKVIYKYFRTLFPPKIPRGQTLPSSKSLPLRPDLQPPQTHRLRPLGRSVL